MYADRHATILPPPPRSTPIQPKFIMGSTHAAADIATSTFTSDCKNARPRKRACTQPRDHGPRREAGTSNYANNRVYQDLCSIKPGSLEAALLFEGIEKDEDTDFKDIKLKDRIKLFYDALTVIWPRLLRMI